MTRKRGQATLHDAPGAATPSATSRASSSTPLGKKIDEIASNSAGEPDLYAYIRVLLTRSPFGIGLTPNQVVIDSKIAASRRRPDLVIYRSLNGRALRGSDFAAAVFEVKPGDAIAHNGKAIAKEKRSYVQPGTRWFFLADQTVVWRIDVADPKAFDAALDGRGPLPDKLLTQWTWNELKHGETFAECFGVVSRDALLLETELQAFRENRTRYAYLDAGGDKRALFGSTVRAASESVRVAVEAILLTEGIADLKSANLLLATMEDYGSPVFDWNNPRRPVEFERMTEPKLAAALSDDAVVAYETRLDTMMADLEPVLYALRIENDLLQQYGKRQGVESPSLLKLSGDANKGNQRLVDSLVYETASLILSRMLTIRFCEDHTLFKVRYISNGGIEIFWRFADHFALPMQELLRQSYKHAGDVFRSIFDANLLDWAVRRDDPVLSDALLRAAFVLSRWDFRTVRGDILSGVYDQYLDVAQRRKLGEVYTRPEIARFMLEAAGWTPEKHVLDPACGTGTFLVEALSQRLAALSAAGAVTADTVREVVGRLHGLDISTFSVTLAQIQFFWHLIDVVSGKSADEIRAFARSILPVLRLHGGWSSLDTMGEPLDAAEPGTTAQSGLAFRIAHIGKRKTRALVPAGFERAVADSYDIVVMNPPYIRAERAGGISASDAYAGVTFKNTDSSIFFIYRALKQWVKPGGTLAFIVPIGMSEAAYAGPLRKLLGGYRIKMIVDLEGLGKTTFRGVKRATIIMIVEKTPGSPNDDVEMLQLDGTAMVGDTIDFGRARRSIAKRRSLERLAYLPKHLRGALLAADATEPGQTTTDASAEPSDDDLGAAVADGVEQPEPDPIVAAAPVWLRALRADDDSADAILTKMSDGDADALAALAELPRLGDIVKVVYVKRAKGRIAEVLADAPTQEVYAYRPELLFNYGVKLGGPKAFKQPGDEDCITLFKGQNIFPQGLLGASMGEWSPTSYRESNRGIYSYAAHLSNSHTFAAREISQLPTLTPVTEGQGFQNTAFVMELTETFPLNSYTMSRIVQFYAARVLRSSIIEDLGCHWYKRTLTLLPIPRTRDKDAIDKLTRAGQLVLEADSDIADRYRLIDALIAQGQPGSTVARLVVNGDPHLVGIDLNGVSEAGVVIASLREERNGLASTDLFFNAVIPDTTLRRFVKFVLDRALEHAPDDPLSRAHILDIVVPTNLDAVVKAVESLSADSLEAAYDDALGELDAIVAQLCGIIAEHRDHMISAMKSDPLLSKMRPMIAQRGLRIQPYADHSESSRYD